jgi:hypothetical protein
MFTNVLSISICEITTSVIKYYFQYLIRSNEELGNETTIRINIT